MKINQFRINKYGGMNKARPLAIYATITGSMMMAFCLFLLLGTEMTDYKLRPIEISFHMVIEFCTALMLIINGLRVIYSKGQGEGLLLVSIGMLIYTALNNTGYYAEKSSLLMIAMFLVILISAIYLTIIAFHGRVK
jgi:hypothetical protein